MGVVGGILLVVFIIVCALLVLLVLVQDDESNGMGGMIGSGSAAFGSRSANVVTKTTGVLAGLFFVLAFFLALSTAKNGKAHQSKDLSEAALEVQGESSATDTTSKKYWEEETSTEAASEVSAEAATEGSAEAASEESAADATAGEVNTENASENSVQQ